MDRQARTQSERSCASETMCAASGRERRSEEGLLDMSRAARYLGTSERHLRRLWQERRVTAIKVGRRVRFTRPDLEAFIEANRHETVR
jgi:excisionase family DNA binding protein